MKYKQLPFRESDQLVFVADNTKITLVSGWKPIVKKEDGILMMTSWLQA
jgi:CDP-paratose 2-epimerase